VTRNAPSVDRSWESADLRSHIRAIPNFPKPGITYRDITPVLLDPLALSAAVDGLAAYAASLEIDCVVAAEARGFILGAALARALGVGFVPARKPGKLPHTTVSARYALEYGHDELEIHSDAIGETSRVLVHDDLLATGGTARALCDLVSGRGGVVVGCAFLVELSYLGGRAALVPHPVHALVDFASE
jgi:adenine phosphoribosyltransferase